MDRDMGVIMNKMRNRILELLSAGVDDEEIRKEMAGIDLDISISDIHQIRVRWNRKMVVDREMVGSIEELGDAPVMSEQELMEANAEWNRMMIYWECRRDDHMREKVRVANVIYTYRNQQRKERDPM